MRIVVPDDFPSVIAGSTAEARLQALGDLTVFSERGADREEELARRVADADIVVTLRAHARFTPRVIAAAPRLRLISIWGTGYEHVDLAACHARGIAVTNTPGVNAHAVAEHTMALILAVFRRIPVMDSALRAGNWPRERLTQLDGKTLGIVGLGAIGQRVAALAKPFGVRLLAWTRTDTDPRAAAAGARWTPIETLLAESDVVSLHLRLTPETTNFLDAGRLAMMKRSAILINTARAALVERDALLASLANLRIAGAGLDVFHTEPLPADDPLLALRNVVLSPHNAGTTTEAVEAGLGRAVETVVSYLAGTLTATL